MIWTFLATRLGKFVAGGLAIVLAVAAFMLWLNSREKAAVRAHEAKVTAETLGTARRADEAADAKSDAVRSEVEKSNAEVRDAARDSADPLATGFDRLRNRKAADSPPAG